MRRSRSSVFGFFPVKAMRTWNVCRVFVLTLVILTTMKLLNSLRKDTIEATNYISFWERNDMDVPPEVKVKPAKHTFKMNPEEHVEVINESLLKTRTGPLRIVHLDLKGAAPKVKYLKQIFPLLSSLGANGILLEYEDMFPYEGELEALRSPFAYSVEEIEEIKTLANLNKLELIPLVQVFGHLEFVLKHEKYFSLREVPAFPNSLNPLAPGAMELVKKMLMQVLKKHPQSQWFHIGADEVFGLGESEDSKNWFQQNNGNVGTLYLSHVKAVSRFLAKVRPGIKIIFWDDMLRKINSAAIRNSGIQHYAFPMIWNYLPNMDVKRIGQHLAKYQEAGIKAVWFASAFKGATGIDQRWTPLKPHLQNHLAWIKVMDSLSHYPSITYQGIALTGWQRYEHHTVLCELLPVAIPSLAVCLQTLKHGSFNVAAEKAVHTFLGCNVDLAKNDCQSRGVFAGSEVYYMVRKIDAELQNSVRKIMANHYLRGSLSPYLRKYNFGNPRAIGFFMDALKKLLEEWEAFLQTFRKEMEEIFYPDAVEEWMEDNVNQHMDKLHGLCQDAEHILKRNGQPKSLSVS